MTPRRPWLDVGLELAAGLTLAAGLVPLITGGRGIAIGPWTIPVREVWRPFTVAGALLLFRLARARWLRRSAERVCAGRTWTDAVAVVGFTCGIAAAVLVWTHLQVRFCGGLDSYGYVSAARAIVSGEPVRREPMIEWLPFSRPIEAATPLGWIPAPSGDAIVPAYPLGFPMAMAAFIWVAGPGAAFYVPLLAGLGVLVLTYRLTHTLTDPTVAAVATLVVAWNPVLTNMVVQPMSDAPAAFWYLLAVTTLLVPPARPVMSGLGFAMAVWTRPLVLALVPGLLWVMPRRRQTLFRFIAGTVPVFVAMAGMQWLLYGSPLRTGYGGTAGLFTTGNTWRHLLAFGKWTIVVHSPLFIVALAAGIWRAPRRLVIVAVTGMVTGIVPYLFNLQYFDDWDLVRYTLPALVPCVIVATVGVASLVRAYVPRPASVVVLLCLAAAVAAGSFRFVAGQSTWQLGLQESRYALVAEWFRQHTPPDAIVLADLHSGSLRLYANRATLRWVRMPPGSLAPTVTAGARRGIAFYAALDGDDEARSFQRHFAIELQGVVSEPVGRIRNTTVFRLSPQLDAGRRVSPGV